MIINVIVRFLHLASHRGISARLASESRVGFGLIEGGDDDVVD